MRDRFLITVVIPVALGSSLLVACSRGPAQATHTVEWYLAHNVDRAAMVERCANNPGTLEETPDCVNAFAAAQRADIGSLRKLPPLGLMNRAGKPPPAPRTP